MKKIFHILIFSIVLGSLNGCSSNDDTLVFDEPVKNIAGKWSIIKVTRNGQDITNMVDFSQFRINFLENGSYNFENYLPFVVSEPGTWSLDDPQFAYKINFQTNSNVTKSAEFTYPIIAGKRQIQMDMSPGCDSNVYTYVLERVSE